MSFYFPEPEPDEPDQLRYCMECGQDCKPCPTDFGYGPTHCNYGRGGVHVTGEYDSDCCGGKVVEHSDLPDHLRN